MGHLCFLCLCPPSHKCFTFPVLGQLVSPLGVLGLSGFSCSWFWAPGQLCMNLAETTPFQSPVLQAAGVRHLQSSCHSPFLLCTLSPLGTNPLLGFWIPPSPEAASRASKCFHCLVTTVSVQASCTQSTHVHGPKYFTPTTATTKS